MSIDSKQSVEHERWMLLLRMSMLSENIRLFILKQIECIAIIFK